MGIDGAIELLMRSLDLGLLSVDTTEVSPRNVGAPYHADQFVVGPCIDHGQPDFP
jgi:hypothetical protein